MIDIERKRLLWVWHDMRGRCTNENHKAYKNYGARGISVCDRWQKFENFISDMGPRKAGESIERVNNNLGYSPDNCKWIPRGDQNKNRRNCIYVNDGESRMTLKEYCRANGLKYRPIAKRIKRGWSLDEAINKPINQNGGAKLSESAVAEIREKFVEGKSPQRYTKDIASMYGVGKSAIQDIWKGATWKNVA